MNRSRLTILAAAAGLALAAAPAAHATAPPNDHFIDAIALSGVPQPADAPYSLISGTKQIGEPANGGGQTVWFKWTPNTSGAAFADVCGAPTNHNVRVFRLKAGMPIAVYNLETARMGDTAPVALPDSSLCRFRWRAESAKPYYIQIDTQSGVTSSHELIVDQDTSPPAAPTIEPTPTVTGSAMQAKFTGTTSSFFCSYDAGPWAGCSSPHQLSGMTDGDHSLAVRTMDGHGNVSPPSTRTWKVETPKPANELPPIDDPSFTDIPVQGGDVPGGGTSTQTNGTGTTTGTATTQTSCPITLTAKKRISRGALRRKGLKVNVAAVGEACAPEVFLKQGRRTLAKRSLKLGKMTLKGKRAKRGTVTVVAGATKISVKVV